MHTAAAAAAVAKPIPETAAAAPAAAIADSAADDTKEGADIDILKRKDCVWYLERGQRRPRPALVKSVHRSPAAGYTLLVSEQRKLVGGRSVRLQSHLPQAQRNKSYRLLRATREEVAADAEVFAELLAVLLGTAVAATSASASPCTGCRYVPLHAYLSDLPHPNARRPARGRLRIATWNVCHFGGGGGGGGQWRRSARTRREAACGDLRADLLEEKALNLATTIYLSRSGAVVLQEVSLGEWQDDGRTEVRMPHMDRLVAHLRRLSSSDWRWKSHRPVSMKGEAYVLVWDEVAVRLALVEEEKEKEEEEVMVSSFTYERANTGTKEFRLAVGWGDIDFRREDYAFQGAECARPPAYFVLRSGGGRRLVLCTIHSAFGNVDVQRKQLLSVRSLLPGKAFGRGDGPNSCVFAVLGDFNSAVKLGKGESFETSKTFAQLEKVLGERYVCMRLAAQAHGMTSLGRSRYDEIFTHRSAVCKSRSKDGRCVRNANVFPPPDRLLEIGGVGEGWCRRFVPPAALGESGVRAFNTFKAKVFSDHLLVYCDVAWRGRRGGGRSGTTGKKDKDE